jgi:hypothetical protein
MSVVAIIGCAMGAWIAFALFFVGLARAAAYADDARVDGDSTGPPLVDVKLSQGHERRKAA